MDCTPSPSAKCTHLFVEVRVQLVCVPHEVDVVHGHDVHVRVQLLEAYELPVPAPRRNDREV